MINIVIDNPRIEKFLNYYGSDPKENIELLITEQINSKNKVTVKKFHELNEFLATRKIRINKQINIRKMLGEVNAQ
jgi:hypothetical protein